MSKVIKVSQYRNNANWRELRLPDLSPLLQEQAAESEPEEREAVPEEQGERREMIQLERMRILREAEEEAKEMLEAAEEEIVRRREEISRTWEEEEKKLFQKAREEGYQAGYSEGYAQGVREGERSIEGRIAEAEKILIEAGLEAHRMKSESERELLLLSVHIAEKILRNKLEENRELFLEIVKGALLLNEETDEITIRVHPDRYLFLKSRINALDEMISSQTKIILLPDLQVDPDGVVLKTSKGKLDAGIASQLEEIRAALLEAFRKEEES